jgi:hypothetical protein
MDKDKKTKLEAYQDIQAMVQKEVETMFPKLYAEQATKYGVAKVPLHTHNGLDAPFIPGNNVVPGLRASGSITMATDGATYELGAPFKPSSVWFYGTAIHRTGGSIDIRCTIVGNAQLGPTYYFQPQSSTSVKTGGPLQNVIQSSSALLIDSSTSPLTIRAIVSEGHLVSVEYPPATVVARATIPTSTNIPQTSKGYTGGIVFVEVELAADWEIIGNFVVT